MVGKQVLEKNCEQLSVLSASLEVLQLACHDHVYSVAGIGLKED